MSDSSNKSSAPKPGWKSSELYLCGAVVVAAFLGALGVFPAGSLGAHIDLWVLSTLAALGYTASRAFVKIFGAPPPDGLTVNLTQAPPGIDNKAIAKALSAQPGAELLEPKP